MNKIHKKQIFNIYIREKNPTKYAYDDYDEIPVEIYFYYRNKHRLISINMKELTTTGYSRDLDSTLKYHFMEFCVINKVLEFLNNLTNRKNKKVWTLKNKICLTNYTYIDKNWWKR